MSQLVPGAGGLPSLFGAKIANACRFNDDDNAYLIKTWGAAATNDDIVTISCWVKRANLGSTMALMRVNPSNTSKLTFDSSDRIELQINAASPVNRIVTSRVFRDPSAVLHLVAVINTPSATADERLRIYINGVEETAFDVRSNPAQNLDALFHNNGTALNICRTPAASDHFDGYLSDFIMVDGQALGPENFGQVNPVTGQWVPKIFTGSYGTNGLRFDFADSADLGNDVSGNANDFTANGLATNDQVPDTPTNNYCVLSSLDRTRNMPAGTLSDGNLKFVGDAGTNVRALGTMAFPQTGKWYFEVTVGNSNDTNIGMSIQGASGASGTAAAYFDNGNIDYGDGQNPLGDTYTTNDVIGVAVDMDTQSVEWFKNNVSQDSGSLVLNSYDRVMPVMGDSGTADASAVTGDFGQHGFTFTPPTGFKALNARNLPDPLILTPEKYFKANARTGTGASASVSGLKFGPDLVWTKSRDEGTGSYTGDHKLWDKVRGATKSLESNTPDAEATEATGLTAFNSDGFDMGALDQINFSGDQFIDWMWKKGTLSGFDIVAYAGTGVAHGIDHSLGVAPKMMIMKELDNAATTWWVYHEGVASDPETDYLQLHGTAAAVDLNTVWNDTAPTSTQFTVGTHGDINQSSTNYIAYLFAEVPGFSKFGAYEGNGNADGPFVWCGFKPAFIMTKSIDSTSSWYMHDPLRKGYNPENDPVWANATGAEGVGNELDILSNGFKLRIATDPNVAETYVFMAFAEAPFKYARAR